MERVKYGRAERTLIQQEHLERLKRITARDEAQRALTAAPAATMTCRHCLGTGRERDYRSVGSELRKKRIALNLSQRAVAARMNVSDSRISQIELGYGPVNDETLKRYDEVLRRAA